MPNMNVVILEGHLAKDPIAKEMGSGVIVCNFTVATSVGMDEKKKTQFHTCKIWGTQATTLAMHGHQGDTISLKGHIEYRKWEEKYFTDIVVDHLHLTAKKAKGASNEFIAE